MNKIETIKIDDDLVNRNWLRKNKNFKNENDRN